MRRMRAGAAGCALTMAALLAAGGCGGTPSPSPTASGGPAAFVGVADDGWRDPKMADASVRLGVRMVALSGGQNIVVSPVGLQLALAVLRETADGALAAQLDDVIGLPGSHSQKVADLRAVLGELDSEALFVQSGLDVDGEFGRRASAFHGAKVLDADFAAGTAQPVLDAWVADGTGGVFPQAPVAPAVEARMILAGTVTFDAAWAHPFATAATADLPFTLADGTIVPVPTMSGTLTTSYAEAEGWRACEVPFSNGFVMRVATVAAGGAPDWVTVTDALAAAPDQSVHLVMPRWTAASNLDLLPMLQALGVRALARPGNLDGIFDEAFVNGVAQAAVLRIAEAGAVTADGGGATEGDAAPVAASVELVLDHAFEYQVVHEATGVVLFAGRLANPTV